MSFTDEVKDELSRVEPTCKHCEKATLAALVRMEGTLFFSGAGKYRVELDTDSASVGRLIIRLLHNIYHLKTELTVRRSVLHKTPNYLINIPAQPELTDALIDMGIINADGGLSMEIPAALVRKQCCGASYLRGAFLGTGFISNPKSDFHFEIKVENEDFAKGIVELMARKDIPAKIMQRHNTYVVYLKSGESILRFLAFTEAHRCALELEEERVVKSVRNDVNRMINAEMANEQKATRAALRQLYTIREVLEANEFETLPKALQEFIQLRVSNPEISLKELGERADPPLSKSAIAHRYRRLEQLTAK